VVDALLVSSSFLPGRGGIESYLAELCRELSPRLAVFAPAKRDGKFIPSDLPYPTTAYEGTLLVPHARAASAIEAAARDAGTNRILLGTPWPLALLGPRLRRAGLRYAAIVHGAEFMVPGAIPVLRQRLARSLADADLLLPVSAFTKARLKELIGTRQQPPIALLRARVDTTRFHPNVDTTEIRHRFGLQHRRVILVFGRLVRRKGVDRLIRALPSISERCPDACLAIAGTGPEEPSLRRLAAEHGERVIFIGRVPENEAPAVFATADVFALPVTDRWWGLETEGLGVALLEAAACGVPCVTGRSGGTPEAVIDGITGLVVDADDKARMVDAIAGLLEDPKRARRMGSAGRTHVESEYAGRRLPGPLLEWLAKA
jgi:phosphatidylinositol alpha-1,6-mannosyltransferase